MRPVRWIATALMLTAYLIARGMIGSLGFGEDWIVGWLVCAVIMFVIVFLHELGHAAIAWRLGGKISTIMVFPFQWNFGSRRLGLAQRHRSGDVGGYVAYRLDRIDAGHKHLLIAAAGPLTNLATAALVLAMMEALPQNETAGAGGAIGGAFIVLSLGVGLANLLPFEGSDGARIVRRLRALRR